MPIASEKGRAMATLPLFPSDDGWPYPDGATVALDGTEPVDDDEIDLDALELRADRHAFDALSPVEYDVLSRRFGLHGPAESMKQLAHDLGCSHADVAEILGRSIDKMRTRLTDSA
jgi:DNA-directed RNA polymerase sigma subunit (sigma70/sigma32)